MDLIYSLLYTLNVVLTLTVGGCIKYGSNNTLIGFVNLIPHNIVIIIRALPFYLYTLNLFTKSKS